jgi:hypothetical protein
VCGCEPNLSAPDMDNLLALVSTVTSLQFRKRLGLCLVTVCMNINASRKAVFHRVILFSEAERS